MIAEVRFAAYASIAASIEPEKSSSRLRTWGVGRGNKCLSSILLLLSIGGKHASDFNHLINWSMAVFTKATLKTSSEPIVLVEQACNITYHIAVPDAVEVFALSSIEYDVVLSL